VMSPSTTSSIAPFTWICIVAPPQVGDCPRESFEFRVSSCFSDSGEILADGAGLKRRPREQKISRFYGARLTCQG
jgi:hypothetical protein